MVAAAGTGMFLPRIARLNGSVLVEHSEIHLGDGTPHVLNVFAKKFAD